MTYHENQLLQRYVVRTSKTDSHFLYFQLESNEGIAFYSTVEESVNEEYRDIVIHSPVELADDLKNILDHFSKIHEMQILEQSQVNDL